MRYIKVLSTGFDKANQKTHLRVSVMQSVGTMSREAEQVELTIDGEYMLGLSSKWLVYDVSQKLIQAGIGIDATIEPTSLSDRVVRSSIMPLTAVE